MGARYENLSNACRSHPFPRRRVHVGATLLDRRGNWGNHSLFADRFVCAKFRLAIMSQPSGPRAAGTCADLYAKGGQVPLADENDGYAIRKITKSSGEMLMYTGSGGKRVYGGSAQLATPSLNDRRVGDAEWPWIRTTAPLLYC